MKPTKEHLTLFGSLLVDSILDFRQIGHTAKLGYRAVCRVIRGPGDWEPGQGIDETGHEINDAEIVFAVHIFFPEYVERLRTVVGNFPRSTFLITASSYEVEAEILDLFRPTGTQFEVRVVPNIGRNFGPTFVEYSEQIEKFPIMIHLHSKRTSYISGVTAASWANRAWALLGENRALTLRALSVIESAPNINLVSADVSDLISPLNFRWGVNRAAGKKLLKRLSMPKATLTRGQILFPVGGMFLARTSALSALLKGDLQYKDFPQESGQRDGTTHHALERLIGTLCSLEGGRQFLYVEHRDVFSEDSSFLYRQ